MLEGEWPVESLREAADLASRSVRKRMAESVFPGKSRIYQRVELSRMFADGEEARRPSWEVLEFAAAHGHADVLIEYIARVAGLQVEVRKPALRKDRVA